MAVKTQEELAGGSETPALDLRHAPERMQQALKVLRRLVALAMDKDDFDDEFLPPSLEAFEVAWEAVGTAYLATRPADAEGLSVSEALEAARNSIRCRRTYSLLCGRVKDLGAEVISDPDHDGDPEHERPPDPHHALIVGVP